MSELDAFIDQTDDPVDDTQTETPTDTGDTPQGDAAPPAEETKETQSEAEKGLLAAKQAEKERRLKAERELEQLKASMSQKQEKGPDIFDNPDQVLNNLKMGLKAEMSEAMVRDQHEDYDTVMDHYENMVKQNPSIHAEVMNAALPASKAYKMAKKDMEMKEIGDVSSFKEKLRQEILAEIAAKKDAPPDLTSVRSSGADPQQIDEIADGTEGLHQLLGR